MKRGPDPSGGDDEHPEPKRQAVPALASVIVEALKMDSLQKLCSSLEPILRRVVSEEVERALAKLGPARLGGRSSPKRIEGSDGRNIQLQFRSRLSLPLFTGGKVEGEQGAAIHVVLLDTNTGHVVTSGPESSAKLDIVVLEGDFNNEDADDWTEEDFESHVVKEREGKRPLLHGDLQVSLKEGVGTLGELTFTDNSSWIRSRKFRLGLKITTGIFEGIRVREAKTEAFTVKDHRGELYKKHYPPALKDEVWRLEKIGKGGSFHKRLTKAGVYTVEGFLRLVVRDSQKLRSILGSGMSIKMWESLVEHAKTCILSGKYYVYYSDDTRSIGAIFDDVYEFGGLIYGEQYYPAELLTENHKVLADSLVKKAYDNWMHVVEYDSKALSNFKQNKRSTDCNGSTSGSTSTSYPASYDHQVSQQNLQTAVPVEQPSPETPAAVGGNISAGHKHGGDQATRYSPHPETIVSSHTQNVASNSYTQFESSFFPLPQFAESSHQVQITRSDSTNLALGPPQQTTFDFHSTGHPILTPNLNIYDDYSHQRDGRGGDDFLSEEDIRMRSHQMLENEDMQHLLHVLNMGGASANLPEDGYGFSSYMPSPSPNFSFDEDRSRPSGKAVVGWLKIKAAMRWGIFIRKKAAEKRAHSAQIIELDD